MDLILIVGFWILTVVSFLGLAKTWRVPADDRTYQRPPWWVWGEKWWRGYRSQLPATLIIVSLTIALTLGPAWGVYVGLVGFVVFVPIAISVALFNRPKVFAPPASRGQEGALAEILRERASR